MYPSPNCDRFYERSNDPWGFRTRWYEQRKREIVIATLPRAKFESCWELGCSNGELTAALALRCEHVLATDGSEVAINEAKKRLADLSHVKVEHQVHPRDWPRAGFDLIIFSELGYNFDGETLPPLAKRLQSSLLPTGVLVACHWRYPIEGCALNGDDVHQILRVSFSLPRLVRHEEDDFILEMWSPDTRSVAAREGMV